MPANDVVQDDPGNRVNEGHQVIGNRDGKFMERLVPNLISAAIAVAVALGGQAFGFWSDTKAADVQTAAEIKRLREDVASVTVRFDKELSEVRRTAEDDRRKTNELSADVKVILAIMQRIERAVDARPAPPR